MKDRSGRLFIVSSIFLVAGLIFLIRLFYIQVIDDQYKLYANDNVLRHVTIYPARGLMYDRNGELLVYNEPAYDLMVIPRKVKEFDTARFAQLIEIPIEEVRAKLDKVRRYSTYKASIFEKQFSSEKSAILREKLYMFPGFFLQGRTLRRYPMNTAAHLLGYVGEVNQSIVEKSSYYKSGDYIGISGLEKSYERELRGHRGLKLEMVDVHNRVKGSFEDGKYDTLSVPGHRVNTTIDAILQQYGEALMANKTGSIVAIEPSTGEILAMVTAPSYDPNLLVGRKRAKNYGKLSIDTLKPLFNRAIQADRYPPGSTFKLVNALIGMQEGLLNANTFYGCQMGFHHGGLTVGCHSHPSPMNLEQSIQHSCNAYYCRAFKAIIEKSRTAEEGFRKWQSHVNSFGLGSRLGTDITNERPGLVPSPEYYDKYHGKGRWKALTVISLAIGQGELGVTPLQMANLAATIANRGHYYTPHMVRDIVGAGPIDERFRQQNLTTIDRRHYDLVVDGMEKVVQSGTARGAQIDSIAVCGKTGTAQNPHGKDHSIFMAFAPKDDPKIAIAVYVENAGFGSTWAAPIASLMMERYLTGEVKRKKVEERMLNGRLIPLAE